MRQFYEKPVSLRAMLDDSAEKYGEKVYLRSINKDDSFKETTFRGFREENLWFGTALFSLGLGRKTVAVLSESREEWLQAYLVAIIGNGVIVPLDRELLTEQLANFVVRAGAEVLVFSGSYAEKVSSIADQLSGVRAFIDMDASEDGEVDGRFISYKVLLEKGKELLERGVSDYMRVESDTSKLAAIIFTSGTTGTSKGVMLSEANILACIHASANMVDFTDKDEIVSVLPMHHTYETCCGILTPLRIGATVDFNNSLKYTLRNFKRFRPTGLVLVPLFVQTIYKKILDEVRHGNKEKTFAMGVKLTKAARQVHIDLRNLVFRQVKAAFGGRISKIICGGAPLDPELVDRFDEIGICLTQGYGITECAPLLAVNPYYAIKRDSVGITVIGCNVKIAECDDEGNAVFLPAGETGEIVATGPNVMLGYFEDPENTAAAFTKDGYFRTGDIGHMDEDGYIYITGRKKNVIVLNNGKNVFPEELEEYLHKLDFVLECVVIGAEGEKDKNDVVLTALIYPDYSRFEGMSQAEIQSYVKSAVQTINKRLPTFKQIRSIEIRKNEFEKTTSKKIIRYKVHERN